MRWNTRATPRGWDVNPSGPVQRATIVIISLVGLAASIAYVLHSLGVVALWEPFPVISEEGFVAPDVEASYPYVDAAGFALVAITAAAGGPARWLLRKPMVIATALAAMGTCASLVVRWSLSYGHYGATTTLFAIATIASIAMLPFVADELYAAVAVKHPEREPLHEVQTQAWEGYIAGVTGILVGVWLLVAPFSGRAARHGHFLGATIAAVGVLSLAQVAHRARWLNVLLGAWLAIAPLAFNFSLRGTIHLLLAGLLLMVGSSLFLPRETKIASTRYL